MNAAKESGGIECPLDNPEECPKVEERRSFLRVFSTGDLLTMVVMLTGLGVSFGTLVAKLGTVDRDIEIIQSVVAQIPINARDVAVLQREVARAENDRRELKEDLLERMRTIEEQNREILRILSQKNK